MARLRTRTAPSSVRRPRDFVRGVCAAAGLAALILAGVPATGHALADTTQPTPTPAVRAGAVYSLQGSPSLWVGGDDGLLHWASDSRAMAEHPVDWSNRIVLNLE